MSTSKSEVVDTLYIAAGIRDTSLADIAMAAAWSSFGSYAIRVASRRRAAMPPALPVGARWADLGPRLVTNVAFLPLLALHDALTSGVVFRQAIILPDTAMILARGLDQFFLEKTEGLVGVASWRYVSSFEATLPVFYTLGVPHSSWEKAPTGMSSDVLRLSYSAATMLYSLGALAVRTLPLPEIDVGTYLAWLLQLMEVPVLSWGSVTKTLPPIYASDSVFPAPHLLSPDFLLYGDATRVSSYSERDLRNLYKQVRGEVCESVSPYGPKFLGRA